MKVYNKVAIYENNRRLKMLYRYRALIVEYFNNISWSRSLASLLSGPTENDDARQTRVSINRMSDHIFLIVCAAGVQSILHYTPSPAVGGLTANVELINNIFTLWRYKINPNHLLDIIDRAIGVYENDKVNSWIRTLNPLFWVRQILKQIVSIPFMLLEFAGFNRRRIESSGFGKLFKAIFYFITVGAAVLSILEKLGYLDWFKEIIGLGALGGRL